jgi:hypothetical protein
MKERARLALQKDEEENAKYVEDQQQAGYDQTDIKKGLKERQRQQRSKRLQEKKLEDIHLLEFIRQVVEETMEKHGKKVQRLQNRVKAQAARASTQEKRFDVVPHLIIQTDICGVCQVCKKRSGYRCEHCDVALHANCFREYHVN